MIMLSFARKKDQGDRQFTGGDDGREWKRREEEQPQPPRIYYC